MENQNNNYYPNYSPPLSEQEYIRQQRIAERKRRRQEQIEIRAQLKTPLVAFFLGVLSMVALLPIFFYPQFSLFTVILAVTGIVFGILFLRAGYRFRTMTIMGLIFSATSLLLHAVFWIHLFFYLIFRNF